MRIYYTIGVVNDLVIRIYDYSLFGSVYILNDINGLKNAKKFAKRLDFGVYFL